MENLLVDRNGGLFVRPGLRYISYVSSETSPDSDAVVKPLEFCPVGGFEPFYTDKGERALLFAVRIPGATPTLLAEDIEARVEFRAMLFTSDKDAVFLLDDPEIGFELPNGQPSFSYKTKYVSYVQIDNKVLALSDAGEPAIYFSVGSGKVALTPSSISVPRWQVEDKLKVIHPTEQWIQQRPTTRRTNLVPNTSFEVTAAGWTTSTKWSVSRVKVGSVYKLQLKTLPSRINMCPRPIVKGQATSLSGWVAGSGTASVSKTGDVIKATSKAAKGIFWITGPKMTYGVKASVFYHAAADMVLGPNCTAQGRFVFYNSAGGTIGSPVNLTFTTSGSRRTSNKVKAPAGTASIRLDFGGNNTATTTTSVTVSNVVVCNGDEATTLFHGSSTVGGKPSSDYYWAGTAWASASIYHPPINISTTTGFSVPGKTNIVSSAYLMTNSGQSVDVALMRTFYDKNRQRISSDTGANNTITSTEKRVSLGAGMPASPSTATTMDLSFVCKNVSRSEIVYIDSVMAEPYTSTLGTYFNGATPTQTTPHRVTHSWQNPSSPHNSPSFADASVGVKTSPTATAPTANTLIASGGNTKNPYKLGVFYTFSNVFGESAPSQIMEVRLARPWSNWVMESPAPDSSPSGTATDDPRKAADQLVCIIPEKVYDEALEDGAIKWNLYGFTWSEHEPVPPAAQLIDTRAMVKTTPEGSIPEDYEAAGFIVLTPSRKIYDVDIELPDSTRLNNYSKPPTARTGGVYGDRIVLIGDADNLGTVSWSSNKTGEFMNFSASYGGGRKTFSAGNITIPSRVTLWHNPQSVDTITILCTGVDGRSNCYYMAPASISTQTSTQVVMGFEETSNTLGTIAPFFVEVLNNGLYRPLDHAIVKSTAGNYMINHSTITDPISNIWQGLASKSWMQSAVLDNRMYILVHNPNGEPLKENYRGNEVWVYDAAKEGATWSKLLIPAISLAILTFGTKVYMSVMAQEGLFILDPEYYWDDYAAEEAVDGVAIQTIKQKPIPWKMRMNTQGANRAHDAWSHLHQAELSMGNFIGALSYTIKGVDSLGMDVEKTKIMRSSVERTDTPWSQNDVLHVGRDMREWILEMQSLPGEQSVGSILTMQYRYSPISVNVGMNDGVVESFEYARNARLGADAYTDNGVGRPTFYRGQPG
jgi:hypothetical protein